MRTGFEILISSVNSTRKGLLLYLISHHQDQSNQNRKDLNEPASKGSTSNEPAKKQTIFNGPTFCKTSNNVSWDSLGFNLVTSKYSMNSFSNSGDFFSVMFPDSDIAKRFHCGHTKADYVTHFGLMPYFDELILSKLSDCPYISYLLTNFKTVQSRKVIIIRSSDSETNCVTKHYLGPEYE